MEKLFNDMWEIFLTTDIELNTYETKIKKISSKAKKHKI